MTKPNIGFIGLGAMGQQHLETLIALDRVNVAAVCDVNQTAVDETAERLGIPSGKRYTSYGDLIGDPDIQAVFSVTPNNHHFAIIRSCLLAGKPVMTEKPFTRTFEEAAALWELYRSHPVPCMVGFSYRYIPSFRFARELIRTGKIGQITSIHVQYLQQWG